MKLFLYFYHPTVCIMHYDSFLTTLILASQTFFQLSVDGKCPLKGRCQKSESRSDHALQGHVYRDAKVSRFPACYAECQKDKGCMSTNYNLVTQVVNWTIRQRQPNLRGWWGEKNSIYAEVLDRYPGKYFSTKTKFSLWELILRFKTDFYYWRKLRQIFKNVQEL